MLRDGQPYTKQLTVVQKSACVTFLKVELTWEWKQKQESAPRVSFLSFLMASNYWVNALTLQLVPLALIQMISTANWPLPTQCFLPNINGTNDRQQWASKWGSSGLFSTKDLSIKQLICSSIRSLVVSYTWNGIKFAFYFSPLSLPILSSSLELPL